MNWNGGTLSRSRNKANTSVSAVQKRHFAKEIAKTQTPPQSKVAIDFSELEHVKKDKLAAQKRSPPSIRADHYADSSKIPPASLSEGRAIITPLTSSPPTFPISSECKKDDSVENQKRKLLAMDDWCGLKNPLLSERVSTSIADVVVNIYEGKGYNRSEKRRLSDSSEAYSPSEGLTGILDSLQTPDTNPHNAEGKRYIANERQQSESARRIVPLDRSGVDGSKVDSCSPHRASPFYSVLERVTTPYASPYLNSDENLFADEHTESQPLFQPSPLRSIVYDWIDIKSDAVLSTGSQLDTRSLTNSPVETEPKMANDYRHPSISGLPQVHSIIRTRLNEEFTADDAPMIASDNLPHITKSGFLRGASYAPARPELHSENLTRFLTEEDIFETSPKPGKSDQHPLNFGAMVSSEILSYPLTEEPEQPAVKPTFIFTKPARFVGDRVIRITTSTGTGESRRRSTDSSLGQVEEEDIED